MVKKTLLLILSLLTLIPAVVFGGTDLPQTGQTLCYNAAGGVIGCAGTGQDGELQYGAAWPVPRFVVLTEPPSNGNVIMDTLTGLMWSKWGNAPDMPPPPAAPVCTGDTKPWRWQDALDYVACVGAPWRLPNILEIMSLMNSDQGELAYWLNGSGFALNTQEGTGGNVNWYWSSTTLKSDPSMAWSFNPIYQGEAYNKTKTDAAGYHFTLPVQTGAPIYDSLIPAEVPQTGQSTSYDANAPQADDGALRAGASWLAATRWADNGTTIADNLTGLVWPKDASTPTYTGTTTCTGGNMTWQSALNYVACLNSNSYLGHTDWRLPNRVELNSIVNYDRADQGSWLTTTAGFTGVQSTAYWSSTTYMCENISTNNIYTCGSTPTASAWAMTFAQGALSHPAKSTNGYVWPVRGGNGLYGSPSASVSPDTYTYPDTYVGFTPPSQSFTITNNGTNNLYINLIESSDQDQFPKAYDNCSYKIIPPTGSCTFDVYFYPATGGAKSASISIPSNISIPDVNVSGNAMLFDLTIEPGANGSISCILQNDPHKQTYICTILPDTTYVVANVAAGKTGFTLRSLGAVPSYELSNILSNITITATFADAPIKRMTGPTYHASFSEALAAASNGDEIRSKATSFVENMVVDKPVTLKGGYEDDQFLNATGKTTVSGSLTVSSAISSGSVIVQNIEFASNPWAAVTSTIQSAQSQVPPQFPEGLTVEIMTPAGVVYSQAFRALNGLDYVPLEPTRCTTQPDGISCNFTKEDRVSVASASKMVTATVLLRLVDQGLLTLDTTTGDILGWTGTRGSITLRDLLSFTSGLVSDPPTAANSNTIALEDAALLIYEDATNPTYLPGDYFYYDRGTHLRIAARMAEIVVPPGNKYWWQIFYEQLLSPLGWSPQSNYYAGGSGNLNPNPAGDLLCTGLEYTRFLMMLLRGGLDGTTRLLSQGPIDQQRADGFGPSTVIAESPYADELGIYYHYGFGNWLETANGQAPSETNPVTRWSSTGKLGWAPWIAADGAYAALIMTQQADSPESIVPSESLKAQLEPLIRAALAQNPPVIRYVP